MKSKIFFSLLLFILSIILIEFYNVNLRSWLDRLANSSKSLIHNNKTTYPDSNICHSLQSRIGDIIRDSYLDWSISVINSNSEFIVDINGDIKRIPASNQKIYTTAFAINKLGPNYLLTTNVYRNNKGYYEIVGDGNPDLDQEVISKITDSITKDINSNSVYNRIILYEEPRISWWVPSWSSHDRNEIYGAPITRLAITSNANEYSVNSPIKRFSYYINKGLTKSNIQSSIISKQYSSFKHFRRRKLIFSYKSAPLYKLLNLANAESHNFTSEVLLKHAAGTWSTDKSTKKMFNWLSKYAVRKDFLSIHDGSGLSRLNRTTTKDIAHILNVMYRSRFKDYYISSMSIAGIRGTLRSWFNSYYINGKFYGKTGTLTGVKAVSGYLKPNKEIKIISIINNSSDIDISRFSDILATISRADYCKL